MRAMIKTSGAEILHWMNSIETDTDAIIAAIPDRSDDEIIEIRQQARCLGRVAWRVECAADAEIMNRVSARRGRLKDENGEGIHAAVLKTAQQTGLSERTIYDNAAIHKTFFASASTRRSNEANGAIEILDDKEFYRAAMRADSPHEMLEAFAQAKTENPFFNTQDAWRMVKESATPALDSTIPALSDRPEVISAWEGFQRSALALKSVAPRLSDLIRGYLEEVQYELTLPEQTVEAAIYDLIQQGIDEVDMIAARLQRDRIHVQVWLNRLVEMGNLSAFDKERPPGARGAARRGYRAID